MIKLNHFFRIFMLVVLFLTAAQVRAAQGYAVLSDDGTTLTFYYGTPSGTYFNTDNTGTNYPGWYSNRATITSVVFDSSFANARPRSCCAWFYEFTKLNSISGIEYLNTSSVTNMSYMFYYCYSLRSLDVSNFSTSNVTDMSYMFYHCWHVENLDVSGFDTKNVTNMRYMFAEMRYLESLDVSGFDTRNVTNMAGMFVWCQNPAVIDVSHFNTSKVTNMSGMFWGCTSVQSLDVSGFDTKNVTTMEGMFSYCQHVPSLDVSHFNTSKVTSMQRMFIECWNLTSLDVSRFDTRNVTSMCEMFMHCSSLLSLDLSTFNTSNVTDMTGMFSTCYRMTKIDISSFNTPKLERTREMFYDCRVLTSITFPKNFNMGLVTRWKDDMFWHCYKLRYIDFYASDDTDAITDVNLSSGVFNGTPVTTVIFLPHGSSDVTDVTNVVYSYGGDQTDLRCPTYYSEDRVDIEFPRDFKANTAQYTRRMGNTYGSVILPYAFTTNENIQAYTQDWETNDIMHFKDTETVPAHTPFAFKKLADGTTADFTMTDDTDGFGITVKATRSTLPTETTWDGNAGAPYSDSSTAVQVDGWSSRGYYINQKLDDYADTYYIAKDKFYKADGQITVYPHRVSFHNPNSLAAVYNIDIEDDITTAIKEAELRKDIADAQTIYDAAGRQVSQPRKGLNIIRMADGSVKKVIIK